MADDLDVTIDPDDPGRVTISEEALRNLRGAADRNKEREAEAERHRRENVALRAGVDLDNPNTAFLLNGWPADAEFTVETVKAAAEGLNLLKGQTPAAPATGDAPVVSAEEQGQTDVRQSLQPGSQPVGTPPEVHPSIDAWREFDRVKTQGGTEEDALAAAVNRVVQRAASGTAKQLVISGGDGEGSPVDSILERRGHLSLLDVLPRREVPAHLGPVAVA